MYLFTVSGYNHLVCQACLSQYNLNDEKGYAEEEKSWMFTFNEAEMQQSDYHRNRKDIHSR